MLYVLIFENIEEGETHTSIWDNPEAAHQQAVSEILDDIQDGWDLDDPSVAAQAKEMNDCAMNGDFFKVVDLWNEVQSNRGGGGKYWSVEERDICTLNDAAPITGIQFEIGESKGAEVEKVDDNVPYLATTQGATCRGPCGNYSPDAYANKGDGTYCCWQCRLMGGYT